MGSNSTGQLDENSPEKEKRNSCIEMLNLVLDEEATKEQKADFENHMEMCMPCYENYKLDVVIKQLIKKTCCGKKVPQNMVDEIRSKVFQKTD